MIMFCVPNSFICSLGTCSYTFFEGHKMSTASHCRGNYTRYFPSVTNCINHVHHHASIMYLEETALSIPSAADYCTQRLSRQLCSVQLDCKAGSLDQGALPPSITAHIFCFQPIRLTLTWQQRGSSLMLRWIASPGNLWMCVSLASRRDRTYQQPRHQSVNAIL